MRARWFRPQIAPATARETDRIQAHRSSEPDCPDQSAETLYCSGCVMWEFWATYRTLNRSLSRANSRTATTAVRRAQLTAIARREELSSPSDPLTPDSAPAIAPQSVVSTASSSAYCPKRTIMTAGALTGGRAGFGGGFVLGGGFRK